MTCALLVFCVNVLPFCRLDDTSRENRPGELCRLLTSLRAGGALLWRTCSRRALLSHSASLAGFLFISPVWEQQSEPPLLTHGELLDAQQRRPPSSLLLAPVDAGCTMLTPRLWAALCRLLLLLTASCRFCQTARHGKTLHIGSGAHRRSRLVLMKWLHPGAARCVNHDFPNEVPAGVFLKCCCCTQQRVSHGWISLFTLCNYSL